MDKLRGVITGVSAYVPYYLLTTEELCTKIDSTDEWILSRVGIKERRILKGEGRGLSFMAEKAINQLFEKHSIDPLSIDIVICSSTTPDYHFPSTAVILAERCGMKNAWGFDMEAACSGFIFAIEVANNFISSGRNKKVLIVAGDKMSSIVNYSDRNTCPLFGDGCGAILVEATTEEVGIMDVELKSDGSGEPHLCMPSGGSKTPTTKKTIDKGMQYVYQEGQIVFKHAVSNMSRSTSTLMERNGLTEANVDWLIPHQANKRIIDAVGSRLGIAKEKVLVNIDRYGNTSAGTIPICLWELESKLRKGDVILLTSFGSGFTWGTVYLKWGYDGA